MGGWFFSANSIYCSLHDDGGSEQCGFKCLYSLLFQPFMSAVSVLTNLSVVRTCVFQQQLADPLSCYALYWSTQIELVSTTGCLAK